MPDTLRFGLIGCGRIAPHHAQAILDLPGAALVAVADILEERAHQYADDFDAEPYLLNTLSGVLDLRSGDLVSRYLRKNINSRKNILFPLQFHGSCRIRAEKSRGTERHPL